MNYQFSFNNCAAQSYLIRGKEEITWQFWPKLQSTYCKQILGDFKIETLSLIRISKQEHRDIYVIMVEIMYLLHIVLCQAGTKHWYCSLTLNSRINLFALKQIGNFGILGMSGRLLSTFIAFHRRLFISIHVRVLIQINISNIWKYFSLVICRWYYFASLKVKFVCSLSFRRQNSMLLREFIRVRYYRHKTGKAINVSGIKN